MRIDSHQHFIDYRAEDYPWIGEQQSVLMQRFLPSDLKPLLQSVAFDGTIAVQARQTLKETEWLLALAEQNDFIKGVVGWVDLCSPDVRQQLDIYSKYPKLKGVRHVIHDEQDDDFMLREPFLRGLKLLGEYGLTYDLLIFEKHLPNAVKLVEQLPEQPFVVDHLAKPRIREGSITEWSRNIKALAAKQNVYCKLSGMVTEADITEWNPGQFTTYLDVVFEAFGPDRLMIGSDWPVCLLSRDYQSVMNIVIQYVDQLSPENREKVLGGNCARFYGVE
ncbi:amidohydrolase family protein [Paenibacillus harenae]|uniref:amidohydrolase family protein n=1 Tax=Paenibacillus harenae TaxID=306543 RepID=UPI00278D48F8|nr:amidohydrolase family protein [Paenibacillus harenae]MDQ0063544.1 L-fuconolactonase [Paenibacillus harenae]